MATPIKRIEKDFLLKVLYDEQSALSLRYGRGEYILKVEQPPKAELWLKANRAVSGAQKGSKLELVFDYRGQAISFTAIVLEVKDTLVVTEAPEFLYKNLTRAFSRVSSPLDLKVVFSFHGDRYDLAFPKTLDFEPADLPEYSDVFNPADIKELVAQLSTWSHESATGHKLVMFKDAKPKSIEERLIAQTGKALFIPSTQNEIPSVDTGPKPRLITLDMFKRFIESSGTDKAYVDDATERFMRAKREAGIYSELWSPIQFQEYVIGYIHLWIDAAGKPPFDLAMVDTLHQFAKVLAYSLKMNGYFKSATLKNEPFPGKIIDISASGMLFANSSTTLSGSLLLDSEIDIQLTIGKRVVKTTARIVRRYRDASMHYYGCRYLDIAPEDLRFMFEYLYGKALTDADASFKESKA